MRVPVGKESKYCLYHLESRLYSGTPISLLYDEHILYLLQGFVGCNYSDWLTSIWDGFFCNHRLGGGNSTIFYVPPLLLGEDEPILTYADFSKGLVQPATSRERGGVGIFDFDLNFG